MSHETNDSAEDLHADVSPVGFGPDPAVELAATSAQRVDRALTEPNNDRNGARSQHDQSSPGAAGGIRSAAASSNAASGEPFASDLDLELDLQPSRSQSAQPNRPQTERHEVIVWDLPAELAENEGLHELECDVAASSERSRIESSPPRSPTYTGRSSAL